LILPLDGYTTVMGVLTIPASSEISVIKHPYLYN